MPGAEEITQGLRLISREWAIVAILWHVYVTVIMALVVYFGPEKLSRRWSGVALVPPLLSVSALAWMTGNPFNGVVFGLLSLLCLTVLLRWPPRSVTVGVGPWIWLGAGLMVFGWAYPHFVETESLLAYLYEAPLGLVPCPTLSTAIGMTMVLNGLDSKQWSLVLSAAGLFYGVLGAVYLDVTIDWVLALGALSLLAVWYWPQRRSKGQPSG